jgi:hypothetical protein
LPPRPAETISASAGFAFDLTSDYTLPILAGVVANIIAAAIIAIMLRKTPAIVRN